MIIHVEQIKEIVTHIMNVRMVLSVVQIIVQIPLESGKCLLNLIAVMPQLLEVNIFVHLKYLVEKMKEIAILTMNAKPILSVILQKVVQIILVLHLMSIAVPIYLDVSFFRPPLINSKAS